MSDTGMPSDDVLREHAYLVARGVRPLALAGWCDADAMLMLRTATRLESVAEPRSLSFVLDHGDGSASYGFAAAKWVIDLYEWVTKDVGVPQEQRERITGLLLGYAPEAITDYEANLTGRRFLSPSALPGLGAS